MRLLSFAPLVLAACADTTPTSTADDAPIASNMTRTTPVRATKARPPPLPDDGRRPERYPGEFVAANYLGRWVGVEGMTLDVSATAKPGAFRLTMQWDLDHKGTFLGHGVGEPQAPGIAFRREGEVLLLRQANGKDTGLKHLAGRYDCLMVKSGEGYCRD